MAYTGNWHTSVFRGQRELIFSHAGTTVKREDTKLGPVAARKEVERRNAELRKQGK